MSPRRRPNGRPPIVADPGRVARMLDAISAGVPIEQAAIHAGIGKSSHYRAIEAAQAADQAAEAGQPIDTRGEAYRAYRDAVERARAAVAVAHVALIGKAARGGALTSETTRRYRDPDTGEVVSETSREFTRPEWKASAWLLTKSFPAELGESRRTSVEVSGPNGGPVEHAGAGDEALQTIAERLAAVAQVQASQAPGGWDADGPRALDAARVIDVEAGPVVDVPDGGSR